MLDAGLYRRALPAHLRAQAADGIDFTALRGNTVGVLGAGASAFDNVAEALDAGANPLHLFCRRDLLQTIQQLRYVTFYGFLRHLGDMDDERRWRSMQYVLGLRESFPRMPKTVVLHTHTLKFARANRGSMRRLKRVVRW